MTRSTVLSGINGSMPLAIAGFAVTMALISS